MVGKPKYAVTLEEREAASELSRVWRVTQRPRAYQSDLARLLGCRQREISLLERAPAAAPSRVVRLVLDRLGGGR